MAAHKHTHMFIINVKYKINLASSWIRTNRECNLKKKKIKETHMLDDHDPNTWLFKHKLNMQMCGMTVTKTIDDMRILTRAWHSNTSDCIFNPKKI